MAEQLELVEGHVVVVDQGFADVALDDLDLVVEVLFIHRGKVQDFAGQVEKLECDLSRFCDLY